MQKHYQLALARSRVYLRLSQGFWRPTKKLFKECQLDSVPTLEELQREYDRLFTHRLRVPCPIYEAEYDKNRSVTFGPTLADIAGFYRAFGLELSVYERPDHLAIELEFLSVLAYKEALAQRAGRRTQAQLCRTSQRKFLEAHLGRWAGLFSEILARESKLEFYIVLGALLKTFIESECRWLGAKPETITTLADIPDFSEIRCLAARGAG